MLTPKRVDVGPRAIDIPVADFVGSAPGKTLLVTAGMDGDEYASIEAAYRLVEEFSRRDFRGRLVVVPIVNVMGFWNECSQNPVDGLFPKARLMGKQNGTSTERLMHWLTSTYAVNADCWFDAHGGAITERVRPLLWTWRARTTSVIVDSLRQAQMAELFVDDVAHFGGGAAMLAQEGCAYVIGESGECGRREERDIARHTAWIHGVMHLLGMIDEAPTPIAQETCSKVAYVMAPMEGIWRPEPAAASITKGDVLGTCTSIDGRKRSTVKAPATGVRMFWKETMALRRGDVVCAIAHPRGLTGG